MEDKKSQFLGGNKLFIYVLLLIIGYWIGGVEKKSKISFSELGSKIINVINPKSNSANAKINAILNLIDKHYVDALNASKWVH